uniref:hypothetical protein n=1 Tax=Microbacterium sp. TaxID=51671 RepID=UPI0035AF148F
AWGAPGAAPLGGRAGGAGGWAAAAAGLPSGSPSILSGSSVATAEQTTITLVVAGTPGATVEARIRGTARAGATLDADGRAVLTVLPSAQELAVDARLELRYAAGPLTGVPTSVRLSTLL